MVLFNTNTRKKTHITWDNFIKGHENKKFKNWSFIDADCIRQSTYNLQSLIDFGDTWVLFGTVNDFITVKNRI